MAVAKRRQVKKYKFEMSRGAIGGIGVVCFCIFLWMFLLGVWTGQSLLMPSSLEPEHEAEMRTAEVEIENAPEENVIQLSEQKKRRPQEQ